MEKRNVIAIGLGGSGKSWFLNQVLESKSFPEARTAKATSSADFETNSKLIKDVVNDMEYQLCLHDTPGLETKLKEICDKLEAEEFNQVVLVFKMSPRSDPELERCLDGFVNYYSDAITKHPELFTLVINSITSGTSDEQIIAFIQSLKARLGLINKNEFVCIRHDEVARNSVFKYVVYDANSPEQKYQSLDKNFLAVVSQSKATKLTPKTAYCIACVVQ